MPSRRKGPNYLYPSRGRKQEDSSKYMDPERVVRITSTPHGDGNF